MSKLNYISNQLRFVIQDWAGNVLLNGRTFPSFEEGWEYILGELTDALGLTEEDYQEYYVMEANVRESRYLAANDPRKGLKNE